MKKLFIAALVALAMAACKNAGTTAATAEGAPKVETVYDIAYIQMDSLVTGYGRYVDLSQAFEAKATKIQSELESRARRLQNEVMDFQEKMEKGLATRSQLATMQEGIERRGQNLEIDRQNQLTELAEEEQVMTNQIMHAIQTYVAEYNADLRYKMILTTSGGTPVLHADPALDITAEILKGLNEEYAAEAKTEPETAATEE
ncbi:MAG: OmpH family outer membrane protein [Alistipes sp.]|jgi:outer membrane protein|nr:OmpH family outer membrane protein [Alistipes sp.]